MGRLFVYTYQLQCTITRHSFIKSSELEQGEQTCPAQGTTGQHLYPGFYQDAEALATALLHIYMCVYY